MGHRTEHTPNLKLVFKQKVTMQLVDGITNVFVNRLQKRGS